jgi:hypothetical protein
VVAEHQKPPAARVRVVPGPHEQVAAAVAVDIAEGGDQARWVCRCSCGTNPTHPIQGQGLRNGETTSCGCVKDEQPRKVLRRNLAHPKIKARAVRVGRRIWPQFCKTCGIEFLGTLSSRYCSKAAGPASRRRGRDASSGKRAGAGPSSGPSSRRPGDQHAGRDARPPVVAEQVAEVAVELIPNHGRGGHELRVESLLPNPNIFVDACRILVQIMRGL